MVEKVALVATNDSRDAFMKISTECVFHCLNEEHDDYYLT